MSFRTFKTLDSKSRELSRERDIEFHKNLPLTTKYHINTFIGNSALCVEIIKADLIQNLKEPLSYVLQSLINTVPNLAKKIGYLV